MGFQPLPSTNGRRHLPFPRGQFIVGTVDIMTKTNLLMRCFYPTAKVSGSPEVARSDSFDSWPLWLPSIKYAEGYVNFKFSGMPLLGRFFRWLVHNPLCPTVQNGALFKTDQQKKVPTLIFSHGNFCWIFNARILIFNATFKVWVPCGQLILFYVVSWLLEDISLLQLNTRYIL